MRITMLLSTQLALLAAVMAPSSLATRSSRQPAADTENFAVYQGGNMRDHYAERLSLILSDIKEGSRTRLLRGAPLSPVQLADQIHERSDRSFLHLGARHANFPGMALAFPVNAESEHYYDGGYRTFALLDAIPVNPRMPETRSKPTIHVHGYALASKVAGIDDLLSNRVPHPDFPAVPGHVLTLEEVLQGLRPAIH